MWIDEQEVGVCGKKWSVEDISYNGIANDDAVVRLASRTRERRR